MKKQKGGGWNLVTLTKSFYGIKKFKGISKNPLMC